MSFDIAIARVLANEGGYTPGLAGDPGGETNFGISRRSYPSVDIKGLTRDGAVAIYRSDFWDRISADSLPPLLQFQALDFAVNCGIGTAVRKVQSAAGVADDGNFGPVSLAAIAAMNPAALTFRFFAEELDYRRRLSNWPQFGAGWTARVAADLRFAAADLTASTTA